jgi:hypothetical protein
MLQKDVVGMSQPRRPAARAASDGCVAFKHPLGPSLAVLLVLPTLLGCSEGALNDVNHMPVVRSVTYTPSLVLSDGAEVVLRAEAVDEDGDGLDYFWAASDGALDTPFGEAVTWTTPVFGGDYQITVSVSDGRTSASSSILIHVTPRQFAGDISVASDPTGAQIVLNGQNTNFITPHTFSLLPVGLYDVSLFVPDCSVAGFAGTNCLVFPATRTVLAGEDEVIQLSLQFIRRRFSSNSFSAGVVVSPPQMNLEGAAIIWSDNAIGEYRLVRNGVLEGPASAVSLNLIGYDGEIHYPNWRAFQRIYFQSSVADTGSSLYGTGTISGGTVTRVAISGDARQPAFSRSGGRLAYVKHVLEGSTFHTYLLEIPNFAAAPPWTPDTLASYTSSAGRVRLSTPRYSATDASIIYSVTTPDGQSDLHICELASTTLHQISTSGDRVWPVLSAGDRYVFWEDTNGRGIFGSRLDQTTWSLGAIADPVSLAGSHTPTYGSNGTVPYIVTFTQSGILVLEDFDDS